MSKVPIKPLGERIVATREEAATKTTTGLYLPTNVKEKSQVLTVVAIGDGVKSIKVSDRIVVDEASYGLVSHLKVNNTEYVIVKEENVLAIVE